jgi:chaperone protein EcpD
MGTVLARWLHAVAAALLLAAAPSAGAAVSVQGTRVVFLEEEGETLVRLSNLGASPVLTQAWIDEGDSSAKPSTLRLPLTLSPPVARIDPGGVQVLRIFQTAGGLPEDRESLLWLNVLEIPPKHSAQGQETGNTLQFAFRTRIKLFYRPKPLQESPETAHEKLHLELTSQGGLPALRARNHSAYHLTFRQLLIRLAADSPVLARLGPSAERMVAPGQSLVLPLKAASPALLHGARAFYTLIDDYGGDRHGERLLGTEGSPGH